MTTESNLVFEKGTMFIAPGGGGAPTPFPPGSNGQSFVYDDTTELGVRHATGAEGDVTGPGSAVDNTLPRYDGTTGRLLKGSQVVVDDSGNMSAVNSLDVDEGIAFAGSLSVGQTNVTMSSDDPYVVLDTDYFINIVDTSIARTITLPADPGEKPRQILFKDASLDCSTNNITIDGNGQNIASSTTAGTYVMNQDGQAISLIWTGAFWAVVTGLSSGSSSGATLSPYIIGESGGDYTDFQAAIDAAVLAGYSYSNPVNIYVKPTNATYVNSFTMADGINLVGLGLDFNGGITGVDSGSVRVYAPVIFPDGATASVQGISFYNQDFEIQGGNIFFDNCNFLDNSRIYFTGTTTKNISLNKCNSSGTGSFYGTDGSVQLINIFEDGCISNKVSASVFDTDVVVNYQKSNGQFSDQYTISGDSCVVNVSNCVDTKLSGRPYPFNLNAASNCIFTGINFSTINGFGDFVGVTILTLDRCRGDWINTNVADGTTFVEGTITNIVNGGGGGFDSQILIGGRVGFKASNQETGQTYISTTDDTPTVLLQVELLDNVSIELKGNVIASSEDHTDTCGGPFLIVAQRPVGGPGAAVGSIDATVKSSSTATFAVTVDNTNPAFSYILVTVTGIAATNYNWTTTYEKVRMLDAN